jgi:hypothetical protein
MRYINLNRRESFFLEKKIQENERRQLCNTYHVYNALTRINTKRTWPVAEHDIIISIASSDVGSDEVTSAGRGNSDDWPRDVTVTGFLLHGGAGFFGQIRKILTATTLTVDPRLTCHFGSQ